MSGHDFNTTINYLSNSIILCNKVILSSFFFFKQKTAYEIGTGDWSSDVCSSDLGSKKSGALPQREMGSIRSGVLPQQELVSVKSGGAAEIGRASCRERV